MHVFVPEEVSALCPGCGAEPGSLHDAGCDVERCALCGRQKIGCGCENVADAIDRMPWTGRWPGNADAEALGLWCLWTDRGWQPCPPDHPEAVPDLNRLMGECRWDPAQRKWVRR